MPTSFRLIRTDPGCLWATDSSYPFLATSFWRTWKRSDNVCSKRPRQLSPLHIWVSCLSSRSFTHQASNLSNGSVCLPLLDTLTVFSLSKSKLLERKTWWLLFLWPLSLVFLDTISVDTCFFTSILELLFNSDGLISCLTSPRQLIADTRRRWWWPSHLA